MNRSPRHGQHAVRVVHPNHKPRVEQKHSPKPRAPANTAFAKPPSHSVAPWDVTQWIDPVQARNPKLAK